MEKKIIKSGKDTVELHFYNGIPINDSNHDLEVNFIDCIIKDHKGKIIAHFSWFTDILVTHDNVYPLSKGARARWKIENETFNTLKNQGYQFEHNFGHGFKYLSHVFGLLIFLAFLIDQVQREMLWTLSSGTKKYEKENKVLESVAIPISRILH